LNHLDDKCPVCAQSYDREKTRGRLQLIAKSTTDGQQIPQEEHHLISLLAALVRAEKELAVSEATLTSTERADTQRRLRQDAIARRSRDLKIDAADTDLSNAIDSLVKHSEQQIKRIIELEATGESLSFRFAQVSVFANADES